MSELPKISFALSAEKTSAFAEGCGFVCSYPRSGNTWTISLLMKTLEGNPFKDTISGQPFPGTSIQDAHYVSDIRAVQGGREWSGLWKSHDLSVASKGPTIYVFRAPEDTLSSYLHLHRLQGYAGWDQATGGDVMEAYLDELIEHWKTALQIKRESPGRLLLVSYEAFHRDPVLAVQQMAAFLNLSPIDQNRGAEIVSACQFEKMVKAEGKGPTEERFFRRGKPGGGKETFSMFQRARIFARTRKWFKQLNEQVTS